MTKRKKRELANALLNFDADADVIKTSLSRWLEGFNLFEILGAARAEIRHSCFLAWLMSPSEVHMMGSLFLRELFTRLVENPANQTKDYSFISNIEMDASAVTVNREYVNPEFGENVRIDIRVVVRDAHREIVIIFENKLGADERKTEYVEEEVKSGQLKDYQVLIEDEFPQETTKKVFVFLTPDGRLPENEDDRTLWGVLSYEDILQSCKNFCEALRQNEFAQYRRECLFVIENYIQCLKRHVVKDPELIKTCKELYNRHHKAIDCITNTLKGEENRCVNAARETINSALHDIATEPNSTIIHCTGDDANGKLPTFRTRTMDAYIPPMPDGKKGSWGKNSSIYLYWFEVKYKCGLIGVRMCLEFGGKGLIEDSETFNRIKILYNKIKGENFELEWQSGKKKGTPHIYHQTWDWKIQSGFRFDLDAESGIKDLCKWVKDSVITSQEKETALLGFMKEEMPDLFPPINN